MRAIFMWTGLLLGASGTASASVCGEQTRQGVRDSFKDITSLAMQMREVGSHFLAKPLALAGEALNSDAVHAALDQTFPFNNEDNCNAAVSKKDPVSPRLGCCQILHLHRRFDQL